MKLIRSILALIVFAGFSFSMTAQNVTINKSQVTLETVLDEISQQTNRRPSKLGETCANKIPNSSLRASISAHFARGFGI